MPLTPRTYLTVTCDACTTTLTDDDEEQTLLFTTEAEARDTARALRWTVLSDGRLICPETDETHQGLLDALMPPEPVMQIAGQLGLDGTEETR